MCAVGLLGVLFAAAVPPVQAGLADTDVRLAARYVAARLHQARLEAARRNANVGLLFSEAGAPVTFTLVADGDGDGVRRADVAAGVDPDLDADDALERHWRRVRAGVPRAVPGLDGSAALAAGADPVRFGSSRMVVFSPLGGATSGTFYLSSTAGAVMAVRVTGATGRIRVWRLDPGTSRWVPW
ncbi:MAG: Tfp pilus assembly protein FimT/FimU [Vicinamibacterales bacterium]